MGRHTKPPSRFPQRAAAAAVVVTTGGLSIASSGTFTAISPADSLPTMPIPVVPPSLAFVAPADPVVVPVADVESVTAQLPVFAPAPIESPTVPVEPPPPPVTEVTVKPGDTLAELAEANGQDWHDLQARNLATVTNPNTLAVGQVLSLVAPVLPLPALLDSAAPEPPAAATASKAPLSAAVSGVVGIAQTFTGVRYVYGGKTRAGLDCSGLVYLVLKQAGLTNQYRNSYALRSWVTPIKKSEARPGDLVFGPGHVAIYAGNGMMIDAPNPGKKVGLRKVYSNMYEYGRVPA